jgi:hypothetical protein
MNYPGAEPTRYQMESFVSDPEGRRIKPQPSRPPKPRDLGAKED